MIFRFLDTSALALEELRDQCLFERPNLAVGQDHLDDEFDEPVEATDFVGPVKDVVNTSVNRLLVLTRNYGKQICRADWVFLLRASSEFIKGVNFFSCVPVAVCSCGFDFFETEKVLDSVVCVDGQPLS